MPFITQGKTNFKYIVIVVMIAVIAGGGILIYQYHSKINFNVSQTPTPTVGELSSMSFSQEDLSKLLNNLVKAGDLEIREEMSGSGDSLDCSTIKTYVGRIKGGKEYALDQLQFVDKGSSVNCRMQGFIETYFETYWIGDEIYNRQYKDKNFEKISSNSQIYKATNPKEYLRSLFSDQQTLVLNSVDDKGETLEIKANGGDKKFYGEILSVDFNFIIDKAEGKISGFTYTLADKDNNTTKASVVLASPAPSIILPAAGESSFLFSSLEDISNYSVVYYSVDSENFNLYTNETYPIIIAWGGAGTKNKDCYLSNPICQEKLKELKSYFNQLGPLIKNAEPVFCQPKELKTGKASEIYKNQLVIKISNTGRNPKE
ncbi:MAG: hypothetical protein COX36_02585, partial [Candidatus Nealsonbacteria bacterium CG23_combo_of_CG06-09_8_20_14_all_38_19]